MASQAATSTTHQPYTHTVAVGRAGYTFEPDVVLAEVGDFIEYAFYPVNHSVIQAAYGYPCIPFELTNTRPGFASPFFPVDAILDDPPTYSVRVNDTDPFFVYCSGPWACIDHGMVAVVNPNANTSLEHQRQLALQAEYVLQPGDKWPGEGRETSISSSASRYTYPNPTIPATVTLTPTPTVTSTSETTTTPTPVAASASHGMSTGAIAGIAIGATAVLLLTGITIWLCGRRSNRENNGNNDGAWYLGSRKDNSLQNGTTTPATMPPAYNPHGMPVMTQAKGYQNGIPTTSVVEHYNLPPSGSPPPQISPHYAQQNFPPHVMDPAAFNYNPYLIPQSHQPRSPTHPPQNQHQNQYHQQQQQYMPPPPQQPDPHQSRQEIYSGTPAPRAAQPISTSTNTNQYGSGIGMPTTIPSVERTSMSQSAHSRGGSPDILAEMNAARSQAGTLNHAGGGALQQPVPIRGGGNMGGGVDRFEV